MQYGRPGNSHSITTTFVPLPDESGGSGLLVSGRQNNTAIRIYSSNRSRVEKNWVTDNNSYGIAISDSQGSRISGNFASGNGLDWIRLYRSPGSIIEHNQSLNNV